VERADRCGISVNTNYAWQGPSNAQLSKGVLAPKHQSKSTSAGSAPPGAIIEPEQNPGAAPAEKVAAASSTSERSWKFSTCGCSWLCHLKLCESCSRLSSLYSIYIYQSTGRRPCRSDAADEFECQPVRPDLHSIESEHKSPDQEGWCRPQLASCAQLCTTSPAAELPRDWVPTHRPPDVATYATTYGKESPEHALCATEPSLRQPAHHQRPCPVASQPCQRPLDAAAGRPASQRRQRSTSRTWSSPKST